MIRPMQQFSINKDFLYASDILDTASLVAGQLQDRLEKGSKAMEANVEATEIAQQSS